MATVDSLLLEAEHSLFSSAAGGDHQKLAELLSQGVDPLSKNSRAILLAAKNGHPECVALLAPLSNLAAIESSALIEAACRGCSQSVSALLPFFDDHHGNNTKALGFAAIHGHAECVKLLIPVSNPKANDSDPLSLAAFRGHADCVALLAPVSDPTARQSYALRQAAAAGHSDCVAILIPISNPAALDSHALELAAENGHAACVALLAPISDSKDHCSHALRAAVQRRRIDCVKILLPLSDPAAEDFEALRFASRAGDVDCVRLLLSATPSAFSNDQLLADMSRIALRMGHFAVVTAVMELSAALSARIDLRTERQYAINASRLATVAFLDALIDQREISKTLKPSLHDDDASEANAQKLRGPRL